MIVDVHLFNNPFSLNTIMPLPALWTKLTNFVIVVDFPRVSTLETALQVQEQCDKARFPLPCSRFHMNIIRDNITSVENPVTCSTSIKNEQVSSYGLSPPTFYVNHMIASSQLLMVIWPAYCILSFHQLSSLQLESVRRRTFASWPSASVDPDALARDGFFYTGEKDYVRCVFCHHNLGAWTPNDHVQTEHARYSPRCSFVAGRLTGNVPRVPRTNDDDAGRLYAFLDDYHASRLAHGRPRTRGRYQSDAAALPSAEQPAFPEFARRDMRRRTFSSWPKGAGAGADPLAEAGFIYTGVGDWVQCFQCGGGIHTWRRGDDPWADHAHFYPYCPFVREHLGQGGGESGMGESPALSSPPAPS
ncbi:death-associated inhibitor of apoptosis 1-like, partial [Penaeus monodon]|uniref:death-associated inhibitor of apoptosis 1-like n=1 Tax=Penaeus monodon TaxID=6687 RepID=UPI0018A739C4